MLEVSGISVWYDQHRALDDVGLAVRAGEIVVILGANGAGKTTLLKALAGIVPIRPGARIVLDGTPLEAMPSHLRVGVGMALVPEGRGVFGELTVRENLVLGAYPLHARANARRNFERVVALFPRLRERLGQAVRTMSGGEQQMVAIGRALMSEPKALLLDEPSLGLSPLLSKELFKAIADIRGTSVAVLLVEQNARLSLAIADRGYLIANGHITDAGPASTLKDDPAVRRAYLGMA